MKAEVYPASKGRWRWKFGDTISRLFDTRKEAYESIRTANATVAVVLLDKRGRVVGEMWAPMTNDFQTKTLMPAEEYSEARNG